jgi:hypothetical protein
MVHAPDSGIPMGWLVESMIEMEGVTVEEEDVLQIF